MLNSYETCPTSLLIELIQLPGLLLFVGYPDLKAHGQYKDVFRCQWNINHIIVDNHSRAMSSERASRTQAKARFTRAKNKLSSFYMGQVWDFVVFLQDPLLFASIKSARIAAQAAIAARAYIGLVEKMPREKTSPLARYRSLVSFLATLDTKTTKG